MVTQNKKILIITGSFGNGHMQVTQSIVNQLNDMNLDHLSVIEHDLFMEAHPILTSICKKWYINSFKYFRNMYKGFYYSRPDKLDKCFYKYYGLNKLINLLIKEKPDLIIVYSTDKDIKKYQKVAPTVVVDYNKHKYLEQQEMLGKIVGKEDKVKAWKKDWEETTAKDGKEIKKAIGQDATVSLFDEFDKKLYTYGDNWGRGGEVLYQAFGLKMQPEQQKLTAKAGWAEVKQEEIEKYAGDYIVSTSEGKPTPGYESTNMWKNLKATKEGHIVKVDAGTYWYNDPYTLDFMRKDLKEKLIKAAK
ncbi:ABC transporter substrate-binding protein [Staphylococcus aureus]|uniref:ABC transporter substrate-binding protein n=1 Tax=Staphylococcus aureus TaxID=1280 RepID=UPI0009890D2F|nr:ABC transporter substrate-binding protein [Staphylococcus aureus]